jgi:hypothetical protein
MPFHVKPKTMLMAKIFPFAHAWVTAMSTTLEFQNHETFHQTFVRVLIAGTAAAGILHFAPGAGLWRLAIPAAVALLAGIWPQVQKQKLATVTVVTLAIAGVALLSLTSLNTPSWAILGAAIAGGGIVAVGLNRGRKVVAILAAVCFLALAAYVLAKFSSASELSGMPAWMQTLVAGAAASVITGLAFVPRHLVLIKDPVAEAYNGVSDRVSGEMKELIDRGHGLWRESADTLPRDDANRQILEEAVIRLFDVARRWNGVEAEGASSKAASLAERMEKLDGRIDAASDEIVRKQYEHAREALAEQLRYLKDISTSRERVVARMHNYLAAMERLRLAVVNVKSASASRDAVDVQPMVETLTELGRDIDTLGETLMS